MTSSITIDKDSTTFVVVDSKATFLIDTSLTAFIFSDIAIQRVRVSVKPLNIICSVPTSYIQCRTRAVLRSF